MQSDTYQDRRQQLQLYFDSTATYAWEQLTSEEPVSRIRQTVRLGRDQMRATLLNWLPQNLSGATLLDAGCGTGALSIEAALRGARVVGVDISPSLIEVAKKRTPKELIGRIDFLAGDMLAPSGPRFDHIVAMDSLIHYRASDMVQSLASLRTQLNDDQGDIAFTFAPSTPLLTLMHKVGQWFPKSDRSPAIEPVAVARVRQLLKSHTQMVTMPEQHTHRISSGFYTSQAMLLRSCCESLESVNRNDESQRNLSA